MNIPEEPAKKRKRVGVLVMGMHRSGTSALARTLSLLGCDLPRNLMAASEGNEVGHWESNAVVTLNEELLVSAGSRWDDWLPINPGWYDSLIYDDFVERGRQLLRDDFAASPLFVLKDPRNCRIAPFWLKVLAAEGVAPVAAITIRSPLEVAESLAARDGMDAEFGLLLWLRHVLDAEFATRGCPRTFVAFDHLLDRWQAEAARMQADLGITWPRLSLHSSAEITAFLQREQRHHTINPNAVLADSSMSRWLREVYAIMLRWADRGEDAQDLAQLDAVRTEFDSAGPAFARLVMVGLRGSEGVGAAARQREEMAAALAHADQQIAEIAERHDELRQQHEARDVLDAELAAEREQLARDLTEAHASAEQLHRQMSELAAERDSEQARNQTLAELRDADQANISGAATALAAESEARARAEREGAELRQAVAGLEAKLSQVRQDTGRAVDAAAAERDAQQRAAAELQQAVAELEAKVSQHEQDSVRTAQEAATERGARDRAEQEEAALRETMAALESRALQHKQDSDRASQEAAVERGARTQAEQQRGQLQQTVTGLESRLLQRQEEITQAWAEAAAERGAREMIQSEIGRLTDQNDLVTGRLVGLVEQITTLNGALRQAEDRAQQAAAGQDEQRRLRVGAEGAGELLKNAVDAAQSQLRSRTDEIAQLTELLGDAEAELTASQARVAELELQSLTSLQHARDFGNKLDAAAARYQKLHAQVTVAADRTIALEAELDDAVTRNRNIVAELADVTARNGEIVAELDDARAAATRLEEQLATARSDKSLMALRLADQVAAAKEEKALAAARLNDRFVEVATLTQELAESDHRGDRVQWLRDVNKVLVDRKWWQALLPSTLRKKQEHKRLRRTGLFDADAYAARYPDVGASGMDPLRHYIWHGMPEGREL